MKNYLTEMLQGRVLKEIRINKNKSCSILFDDNSVLSIGLVVDNEGPQIQITAFGGEVVQWGDSENKNTPG